MNALNIAVSSPTQLKQDPTLDCSASLHETFVSRAANVNRLIDEKARLVMQSARLRALVESGFEDNEHSLPLICELEDNIDRLQERIDRELKGLFYGLQKAPAPSPFMDDLPG